MNSRSLRSQLNSLLVLRFGDGEEVEAILLGADETRDMDITYEIRRILKPGKPSPKGSEVGTTCVAQLKDLVDWRSADGSGAA
jgi:hypothetical protein